MEAYKAKFKNVIDEVLDEEFEKLQEEVKNTEPHVFSAEFEKSMEEILQGKGLKKTSKKRCFRGLRYVAAFLGTVICLGGAPVASSPTLRAAVGDFVIAEWTDKYFVVNRDGVSGSVEHISFEENRVGYLPAGFEKTLEESAFTYIYYRYENAAGEFLIMSIKYDTGTMSIDNEGVTIEMGLNAAGMEYCYINNEAINERSLMWADGKGHFYHLHTCIEKEELFTVMNSITY